MINSAHLAWQNMSCISLTKNGCVENTINADELCYTEHMIMIIIIAQSTVHNSFYLKPKLEEPSSLLSTEIDQNKKEVHI